ncbi:macrophage mannose receptor 1-like [Physella acuta]|uniref:macrophage mannose receptor 1-like n=1 Tax=Physella acuta TaxID=109671 RepID=UPI0027DBC2CE|nr:macrophage mannose receptor 1-like [Physella acuta]
MALVSLVLTLASVASGVWAVDYGCPPDVPADQYLQVFGDFCYQFVFHLYRDYPTAAAECQRHGGTLALVKSRDVQSYLESQTLSTYYTRGQVWIGLSNMHDPNRFLWEDGSNLDYSNWATGHGALPQPTPRCVAMYPGDGGKWYDALCMSATPEGAGAVIKPFICQYRRYSSAPAASATSDLTPQPDTTVATITNPCPPFSCDLDCGMAGFAKDMDTGCSLCQCILK